MSTEGAFVIVAEFEVRPDAIDAFLEAAIADASSVGRQRAGLPPVRRDALEREPNRVLLYEVYDSQAAFDAHLQTPHLTTFRERIEPLVTSRQVRRLTRVQG